MVRAVSGSRSGTFVCDGVAVARIAAVDDLWTDRLQRATRGLKSGLGPSERNSRRILNRLQVRRYAQARRRASSRTCSGPLQAFASDRDLLAPSRSRGGPRKDWISDRSGQKAVYATR